MKIEKYLRYMADKGASDMYFTTGAPVSVKLNGTLKTISENPLPIGFTKDIAYSLMTEEQRERFEQSLELNFALSFYGVGRFRVNAYFQRGEVSLVIRYVSANIKSLAELKVPERVASQVMQKTGLILIVGATGTGKSSTMAALIDKRNEEHAGHILTIEDPIEYAFSHKRSIVGQREVGIDTHSYKDALREAMREAPDVIMIGEIRDRNTMEAVLSFADTGHLVLSTLHAVNANQALDRMVGMFPEDAKSQVLQELSLNLRSIISQRLVRDTSGNRVPAVEIMLNSPFISQLIAKGNVSEIKAAMEKSTSMGMQTFDQSLLALYEEGVISREEALANADSSNNLEWRINFGGEGKGSSAAKTKAAVDEGALSLDSELITKPDVEAEVKSSAIKREEKAEKQPAPTEVPASALDDILLPFSESRVTALSDES
jgi:twitching motility protein PilU